MLLPLVGLALAAVCYLNYYYMPKHAMNEPPIVPSSIPYVGHIIGLLRHGSRYYQITRYLSDIFLRSSGINGRMLNRYLGSAKCGLPIYTLRMLNSKI